MELGVPAWLLAVAAVTVLLYLYVTRDFNYWQSRGIPFVKAYFLVGSFGNFMTKPFHIEEMRRYKKLGRIYGAFEGQRPVLSVADPDLLRDIFVKDFYAFTSRRDLRSGDPVGDNMLSVLMGEEWKRVRTIITPAFTSGKLRKIVAIMNNCSQSAIDNFLEISRKENYVDCKIIFGAFTMDVICCNAFGTKIDSYRDVNNTMVSMARLAFSRGFNWRLVFYFLCPSLMKHLKISIFNQTTNNFFKGVTLQLIRERRESGKPRDDFLQLMMDSAKETECSDDVDESLVDVGHEEENSKIFQHKQQYKNLSFEEIVGQSVLFFLAGYETTASTLSFVAYNLARNPECQEKLIQEIDEVFAKNENIDYDVVKRMQYLDCVISETLRMYPPAIRGERVADVDYKLGDTGITIPKGMLVTIPFYPIHHDEEHYPEPEKFDPLRFLPENKAERNSYTYLPFGAGPRNCIGMRFAQMEIKLCLVQVLRKLRFRVCPETKIPLDFFDAGGLLVPKEVTLSVEERKDIHS